MEKEEDRQREDFPLSEAEKCPIGPNYLSGGIATLMSQQPQLARHEKLRAKARKHQRTRNLFPSSLQGYD